jgi:hypothetical protein
MTLYLVGVRRHSSGEHRLKQEQPVSTAAVGGAEPPERQRSRWLPLSLLLVAIVTWGVARGKYYAPGSEFGYWLGVAGGVMMLTLLFYPLRKYVRAFRNLGPLAHWFRLHMIFGIAGPTLILLHSTFHLGSLNAAVAFVCMLLVALSGIVGRFLYRHIHLGLYGRRATLQEVQILLGNSAGEVRSKLHFAPEVEKLLKSFETWAMDHSGGYLRGTFDFLTLPIRSQLTLLRCRLEISRVMARHARTRGWPGAKYRARRQMAVKLVRSYLFALQRAAQFSAYERLFSLWHVVHVPFIYMLVVSGVFHVIAVHMY